MHVRGKGVTIALLALLLTILAHIVPASASGMLAVLLIVYTAAYGGLPGGLLSALWTMSVLLSVYLWSPHLLGRTTLIIYALGCLGAGAMLGGIADSLHNRARELRSFRGNLLREMDCMHSLLEILPVPLMVLDPEGRVEFFNAALETTTGYRAGEVAGLPLWEMLVPEPEKDDVQAFYRRMVSEGQPVKNRFHHLETRDGSQVPLRWHYTVILDRKGTVNHGIAAGVEGAKTEQPTGEEPGPEARMEAAAAQDRHPKPGDNPPDQHPTAQLRQLAFHDQLTGLYNRHFFEEELDRLDVKRRLPISLIMADVNALKMINNGFGHQAGDQHLVRIADILRRSCRREDIIARWGGDEFLILLPQTSLEEAENIIHRIRNNCDPIQKHSLPASIALGAAVKDSPDQNIGEVLKTAEDRMYRNKLLASKQTKRALIEDLTGKLEQRNHITRDQILRLQKLAVSLGSAIELPPKEVHRLLRLITIHDIGLVNVSEDILKKGGSLTETEKETILRHPAAGYRIASSTDEFADVAEEVLCHHENWDGSGYPNGLRGDEIPVLSRITAITDAYEAMTEGRPYQKRRPSRLALDELKTCAGSQFDPKLTEAFHALITART